MSKPVGTNTPPPGAGGETEITLNLLSAIYENSNVTQRSLAGELGIALGLANSYLKRCARKGFIKISQAPRNRYMYYLTPSGFAEKSRLTAEFLTQSFYFMRIARNQCTEAYDQCTERGWQRIVLWGVGDLAEIAIFCATERNIRPIGLVQKDALVTQFHGLPVVSDIAAFDTVDAVLITDFTSPQKAYDDAMAVCAKEGVLILPILNISRRGLAGMSKADEATDA